MEEIKYIEEIVLSGEHPLTIFKKIKGNSILDEIIKIFPFLENKKISQIIYHFKNKIYNEVICHCCENQVTFVNGSIGYKKYCSNSCQSKDFWRNITSEKLADRSEKSRITCLQKYGVENYAKTSEYLEKSKKTNIEKYGETHHLKNRESRERMKNSVKCKYQVDNISKLPEVKNKKLKKSMNKSMLEKKSIRQKYEKTCLEKYGVRHLSQDSNFLEGVLKKSFSHKLYKLPSGKQISLQGYEPQAMDYLLKKYNESDIITENSLIELCIGKIFYEIDEKIHRYFPDIFIKSESKIIEVKSDYTFYLDYHVNLIKKQSVLDRGIKFDFFIIESNNNLTII